MVSRIVHFEPMPRRLTMGPILDESSNSLHLQAADATHTPIYITLKFSSAPTYSVLGWVNPGGFARETSPSACPSVDKGPGETAAQRQYRTSDYPGNKSLVGSLDSQANADNILAAQHGQ